VVWIAAMPAGRENGPSRLESDKPPENQAVSCRASCKVVSSKKKKTRRNLLLRRVLRMSGRLDSNQRPPEPHSRGSRWENRKSKPFRGLQISHFPYFTQRTPQNPRIPGSFLQFPAAAPIPNRPQHKAVGGARESRTTSSMSLSGNSFRLTR